jgi:serine/threonine protein kinase
MRGKDKQPKTPDDQWAFLTQVLGIVDAIYAIHNYKDKDAKAGGYTIKSQDQLKTIGSHRDLSPQNILVKGGRLLLADFGEAHIQSIKPGEDTGSEWVWGPSTYRAPECIRNQKVGRGGDIWSLACIISEILTFLLLGSEGCRTYSNMRNVDRRDIFHDDFNVKVEVIEWFKKLGHVSGQSKVVVEILKLLLSMLNQNPKSRPPISTVKKQLSEILQHQGPLYVISPEKTGAPAAKHESVTYYDNRVDISDQLAPRTSKGRFSVLNKLYIPFTNLAMPWSSSVAADPQTRKAAPPFQGDSQIPEHPVRTQSHSTSVATSKPKPPPSTPPSNFPESTSGRDSMAPRIPLKDPLEGPLQALRGYDTVSISIPLIIQPFQGSSPC